MSLRAKPVARSRVVPLMMLAAALAPAAVTAAEMVVQGEVVDVVPITDTARGGHDDCHPPRPAPGARLVEFLQWDLRVSCDRNSGRLQISGYRVYYRWDGRTYSQVMRDPPGDTVSLRVQLE
jgi:hypothetical protein